MPTSTTHQAFLDALRASVSSLPSWLGLAGCPVDREQPGLASADGLVARLVETDLSQTLAVERRADLVVSLGPPGSPALTVVLEVQLRKDVRKRTRWPSYLTGASERWECPVVLLVVTPCPKVASWASEPLVIGPGSVVQPWVLGPHNFPGPGLPASRLNAHETIVAAAMQRPVPDAVSLFKQALEALPGLSEEHVVVYTELLKQSLSPALLALPEVLMALEQSPLYKRILKQWQAEARAEGLAQGLQEGRQEGLSEGLQQGRREAALRLSLRVLESKLGPLSAPTMALVEAQPVERLEELVGAVFGLPDEGALRAWLGT
jgi:hypothetical protein